MNCRIESYGIESGTFSSVDGSRQPSQIELDIAKHQATCVGCDLVCVCMLNLDFSYFTGVAGALAKGRAA